MVIKFTRRHWITNSAAGLTGAGLPAGLVAAAWTSPPATPQRVLRLAHLTDVHLQAELDAEKKFALALQHVQQLSDPPELILFGGDNLMNVDSRAGAEKADAQLEVWNRSLKNELSLPYRVCIGNHDVWRLDPQDGKKWAADAFGLAQRYYAFQMAGWQFLVLDSTSPEGDGYKGRLDPEQWQWLQTKIAETPAEMPILVLSHIPILAACAYFDGDNEKSGNWVVPGAWMHVDGRAIKEFFRAHTNVRVALSGHIHLVDEVRYNHVSYYCNGAVCGGWWKGAYQEFAPGYALIDLYSDGTSQRQFINY
jgi:3',5'-cyclic AMP phosphodiesterase CpdA